MTCRSNRNAWRAVEAVRQENRPGSMAASRPVRHGDSMVPAAQEHASPIRRRADQTTLAVGGKRHRPQPSSAVVSAVVVGLLPGGRVLPHTAFVLTWFKIKKRQASVSGALCSLECFCRKMFRHCSLLELLRFLRKSSGNGRMCQGVNCAYLDLL